MPAITEAVNPVTRTVIRLIPPVEIMTEDELIEASAEISRRCIAAWEETPRRDLSEIRDLRGWLKPDAS